MLSPRVCIGLDSVIRTFLFLLGHLDGTLRKVVIHYHKPRSVPQWARSALVTHLFPVMLARFIDGLNLAILPGYAFHGHTRLACVFY